MFRFIPRRPQGPAGPRGMLAYVIGDIHGRDDLLDQLLANIHADAERRRAKKVLLVFVGDLIDRGPGSAQVIERLRTYQRRGFQAVFLLGNHEEVLLRILKGDAELISKWRMFGGTECMASYGVEPATFKRAKEEEALALVRRAIPAAHVEFIESFDDSCRFGDYLIVHAGIRPGVEFDQQVHSDLRWIREPFLFDETDHGFIVVHGHTICSDVEVRANRIGIDTGAYKTGVLTALAIDGHERWFLDTRGGVDAPLS